MCRDHDSGCVQAERRTCSDRDMDCVVTMTGNVWIP